MPVITLVTDFGTRDYYAGAMKGVILGIAPDARIVDVTHDIEPHNVMHGSLVLWQIRSSYPRGTIHLAVVDPGVGSDRRVIIGEFAGCYVVAPDNGLLTLLHDETPAEAVYVVENRRYVAPQPSATFHGRDVMAPVAAHLARGVEPREFGPLTDHFELLTAPHRAQRTQEGLIGQVLCADRFGTLVTNIHREQLVEKAEASRNWRVVVNGETIGPVRTTFCDVAPGDPVALIGGSGLLEIAVNRGSAADRFGPPDSVHVELF